MGDLTREQWLDLFAVWREGYAGRLEAELRGRMLEFMEGPAHELRGAPHRCVCGVEGDPFDVEFQRIRRPHVFVAGLDRLTK